MHHAVTLTRQGHRLEVLHPGDEPRKDAVFRARARWFGPLEDAGALRLDAPESPAPQQPVTPTPAPAPAPAAATPRAAETRAEVLGALVLRRLRALGVPHSALREVTFEAPSGDDDAGDERRGRRVWLRPDAAWVRAALASPERHADVVALAVLGEVNRALDEVTDAHEESALREMLRGK